MNQVVKEFRRGCPKKNVTLFGLHRQGNNCADLHGSDLGISVTKGNFRKIAFFQVKRILNGQVELEHDQLDDAMQSGHPSGMYFILAVDPATFDIRVGSVESEFNNWPTKQTRRKNGTRGPQMSRQVQVASWDQLKPWVSKWLLCTVGGMTRAQFDAAEQAAETGLARDAHVARPTDRPRWLPSVLVKIALPEGYRDYDWS